MAQARKEFKKSIYRILLDFIKCDNIISINEIIILDKLCGFYKITDVDKKAGYAMTLDEAISDLGDLSKGKQQILIKQLEEEAMADGECSRCESLFIAALEYIWGNEAQVLSVPIAKRIAIPKQIIFLDPTFNPRKNELDKEYEAISQIVELAGFEFVYIPKLASDYKSYDIENVKKLLNTLNPSLDDSTLTDNINSLCEMTSRSFYMQILNDKLQLGMNLKKKAVMLELFRNQVNGEEYANYLIYYIQPGKIKNQLTLLAARLNSRCGSYCVWVNRKGSKTADFSYQGFHKILLDLMTRKNPNQWKIKIYARAGKNMIADKSEKGCKHCIEIHRGKEVTPLMVNGREATLYFLLLCGSASSEGYIDFEYSPESSQRIQMQYSEAYKIFSNREGKAPDITLSSNFRPMKSNIMKAVENLGLTGYLNLFKPTKTEKSGYYIPIPAENIILVDSLGERPIKESAFFKKHFKM